MEKGFTLVEIMIAIGIFTAILFLAGSFGLDIYDFGIFLGENLTAQQEIHLTLKTMTSQARSLSQSVGGAFPIESASRNSFIFYSDVDGDGLTDKIRYFLDGNTVKRGIIEPAGNPLTYLPASEIITEAVHDIYLPAGDIFAYYDANYTGMGSPLSFPVNVPDISLVKINITVDKTPADVSSRINNFVMINLRNL